MMRRGGCSAADKLQVDWLGIQSKVAVPSLALNLELLREIRRSGYRIGAVNRQDQRQIAAVIVDLTKPAASRARQPVHKIKSGGRDVKKV